MEVNKSKELDAKVYSMQWAPITTSKFMPMTHVQRILMYSTVLYHITRSIQLEMAFSDPVYYFDWVKISLDFTHSINMHSHFS